MLFQETLIRFNRSYRNYVFNITLHISFIKTNRCFVLSLQLLAQKQPAFLYAITSQFAKHIPDNRYRNASFPSSLPSGPTIALIANCFVGIVSRQGPQSYIYSLNFSPSALLPSISPSLILLIYHLYTLFICKTRLPELMGIYRKGE